MCEKYIYIICINSNDPIFTVLAGNAFLSPHLTLPARKTAKP